MGTAMAQSIIYLPGETKKKLMQKAKADGTSFAQEIRRAIDVYFDHEEDTEISREELEILLAEAKSSIEKMIKCIDKAIRKSDEAIKRIEAREKK